MASNSKRPHLDPTPDTPDQTESSSEEESASEDDQDLAEEQEIQVEFEARTPEERDLHGIISLLRQTFRGSDDVEVTALARFVMKQRSVGSVVTQSPVTDEDDEDEEVLINDGEVFGLATIVRLRETEVADQIIRHLTKSVTASDPRGQLSRLLSSPDADVGLIISERIINMPPQISVPLYQTLSNEVRKARAKNLPFNFTHYLLISKVLLASVDQAGVMFANAEEEVFEPECDLVLEMKSNNNDEARVMTIGQEELIERKKAMVFRAERLDKIVGLVKNAFPIS